MAYSPDPEPSGRGVFAMFAAAGFLGIAAIPFAWIASRREKAPARRNRLPMLWVVRRYHPGMLLAVGVVTGAALSVPSTFLRTYAAELGIPRIGLFFTVVGLTAVATRVASRRLPERFGLAPILLVGLAVMALAQLLFLTVRSEWQLIVPGLVHGVAQAILYPMVTAAGSSSFPSRYRGLGTLLILASLDIGQLIGAPAVGMVLHLSEAAGWASYPTMFLAMAAVLASVAGTYAISLKHTGTVHGGSNGRALRRRVNGVAAALKPGHAVRRPATPATDVFPRSAPGDAARIGTGPVGRSPPGKLKRLRDRLGRRVRRHRLHPVAQLALFEHPRPERHHRHAPHRGVGDLAEGAGVSADGDTGVARVGDRGISRVAHPRRDRDVEEVVAAVALGHGQDADGESAGRLRAAAGRLHDATQPAADERDPVLGEQPSDLLGPGDLLRAGAACPDDGDRNFSHALTARS